MCACPKIVLLPPCNWTIHNNWHHLKDNSKNIFLKRVFFDAVGAYQTADFLIHLCEAYFVPNNAREIPKLTFAFCSYKSSEKGSDIQVDLLASVVFRSRMQYLHCQSRNHLRHYHWIAASIQRARALGGSIILFSYSTMLIRFYCSEHFWPKISIFNCYQENAISINNSRSRKKTVRFDQ